MVGLKNVGKWDRIVRVSAGAVVAILAFWGPENLLFLVGLIPVVTGLVGWCPAYTLFGFKTSCASCDDSHARKAA